MLSKDKTPQYPKEKLKRKHFPSNHETINIMSSITLDIPFNMKKSFADRGFSYTAAKYWNDLPDYIRKAKDIKHFKSMLKIFFLH